MMMKNYRKSEAGDVSCLVAADWDKVREVWKSPNKENNEQTTR